MRKSRLRTPIPDVVRRPSLPDGDIYVRRARFLDDGEVVEESTFATEAELAGICPEQAARPLGPGERPVETAGPLFSQEVER